uniref:Transcriptional repressor NF-X1 n=1 Tax=Sinocyclocheilus grahami TaxID=75366 RepID=A0A672S3A6_SINGR
MAEISVTDTSKLNPESAEFVPQAKPNQPYSRRSYRQQHHTQDWRAQHVRPHHHFRQSDATKHGQDESDNPASYTLPPPELPIRGRGRQRGGRGDGRRINDNRAQNERWTKPGSDNDCSGRDHGACGRERPNSPTSNRSTDEEKKERTTVEADVRVSYQASRRKQPNKARVERSMKEPQPKDQEENRENQADAGDTKPAAVHEHPEPEQRNHKGWRGGDRRMQPSSWRKGLAPNHGIEGNWREREPAQIREEERRGAEGEGGSREEFNRNRGGARGKRPLLQNPGPRRGGGPERRTGPVKCMEPPKSKETQTGDVNAKFSGLVHSLITNLNGSIFTDGTEGWRCPACQHVALKAPNAYTCFCGKVTNPEFQRTEIPHSCGDMCGKKRSGGECNHPCNILCHPGPCPQCPAFITKSCICGRMRKQVRCSQTGPLLCEDVCGALLNCSEHFCAQVCHSGPCQPCRLRVQQDSVHLCEKLCHEDSCGPCSLTSSIKCRCGSNSKEVPCAAIQTEQDMVFTCEKRCNKKRSCGRHKCGELCCVDVEHKCSMICGYKLNCGLHRCQDLCHRGNCQPCWQTSFDELACYCGETVLFPNVLLLKWSNLCIWLFSHRLECDQECATLERNRRLAEALQIDQSVDTFNKSASSKYSDSLKEDARKDFKFVSEIEEEIKNLVELTNKGKQPKRSHCFPPMKREHRRIIHELAEAYGVESVSYDSEPKRNAVVTAIRGKSVCPNSSLAALIERETVSRAPPPIAHIKQHTSKADNSNAWMKQSKEEPTIDYFDVQD